MKNVGIAILCVGVAVSAAYGARLSPEMRAQMVLRGEAHVRAATTAEAKGAYCAALVARLEAQEARVRALAEIDGCDLPEAGAAAPAEASGPDVGALCAARAEAGQSFEAIAAEARAALTTRREADASGLGEAVVEARGAWLAATEAELEPAARAAVLAPVPPAERLRGWLDDSGVFFGLGLLLVVVGAILGRVASGREASEAPVGEHGDAAPARDLGDLLERLREDVAALAAEASARGEPRSDDFESLKQRIHELVVEKVEPIADAAPRVQSKYGITVFADVFGPFSSGERYLNRAWSALVDRHWDEAASSLERAASDLAEARRILAAAAAPPAA